MDILDGCWGSGHTVFFITSDGDFYKEAQELQNRNIKVIILYDSTVASHRADSLIQLADESYNWLDHIQQGLKMSNLTLSPHILNASSPSGHRVVSKPPAQQSRSANLPQRAPADSPKQLPAAFDACQPTSTGHQRSAKQRSNKKQNIKLFIALQRTREVIALEAALQHDAACGPNSNEAEFDVGQEPWEDFIDSLGDQILEDVPCQDLLILTEVCKGYCTSGVHMLMWASATS